jgi:hypothetical protein
MAKTIDPYHHKRVAPQSIYLQKPQPDIIINELRRSGFMAKTIDPYHHKRVAPQLLS